MNCSAIRLNLYGSKDVNTWTELSIDSLSQLAEFASGHSINVTVENHGRITSNIPALMNVIDSVNMDNCGTLQTLVTFVWQMKDMDLFLMDHVNKSMISIKVWKK